MAGGRPTKYKEEYCDQVIEFMRDGSSKVQFCAELKISYQTFLNWQEAYPEFLESVKTAEAISQAWWEEKGKKAVFGGIDGFNATGFIFQMKNRFPDHYSDKKELEHSNPDGNMGVRVTLDDFYADSTDTKS